MTPATGSVAYLDTGNRHTGALLRATLDARGIAHRTDGRLLRFEAADAVAAAAALRDVLSTTEADEVRAFFPTGSFPTVTDALAARSLATVASRVEHAPLLNLLNDESAFYSKYQPIVDLCTQQVVAYEALLRASLDGGELPPGPMFAAAEATGGTHILDRIGREAALSGAAGWLGAASVFVNFIPTSIYRPEVCLRTTMRAADAAGIDRSQIVFEVVESHAVDDPRHLLSILDYYRASGCRIALDDVGAGYSSLTLVAAIRPDIVKIDKDLVQGLPDPASAAVVRAICSLAHDMGATVIAECVETTEQAAAARELGADWAQGWLFGRPELPPVKVPTAQRQPALR